MQRVELLLIPSKKLSENTASRKRPTVTTHLQNKKGSRVSWDEKSVYVNATKEVRLSSSNMDISKVLVVPDVPNTSKIFTKSSSILDTSKT